MNNLFVARQKIEELFNQSIGENEASITSNLIVEGTEMYISFSKHPNGVSASVTTDEYVYRYHYTGKLTERFNDAELVYLSATPIDKDD